MLTHSAAPLVYKSFDDEDESPTHATAATTTPTASTTHEAATATAAATPALASKDGSDRAGRGGDGAGGESASAFIGCSDEFEHLRPASPEHQKRLAREISVSEHDGVESNSDIPQRLAEAKISREESTKDNDALADLIDLCKIWNEDAVKFRKDYIFKLQEQLTPMLDEKSLASVIQVASRRLTTVCEQSKLFERSLSDMYTSRADMIEEERHQCVKIAEEKAKYLSNSSHFKSLEPVFLEHQMQCENLVLGLQTLKLGPYVTPAEARGLFADYIDRHSEALRKQFADPNVIHSCELISDAVRHRGRGVFQSVGSMLVRKSSTDKKWPAASEHTV